MLNVLFRFVDTKNSVKKPLKFLTVSRYGSKFSQFFATNFSYLWNSEGSQTRSKAINTLYTQTNGHYIRIVAFVIGVLIGATLMALLKPDVSQAPATVPTITDVAVEKVVTEPLRLKVPAVGIDTAFEGPLGLNEDGTVEVPDSYDAVGWYKFAPLPGVIGPAVILGHVDSYQGPAVFHPLLRAQVGDTVEIERIDGSIGHFEITELIQPPQVNFPTEAVYGDIDHAGLRLITCSGTFDHGRQVYSHNLIVYAKLIEEIVPEEPQTDDS